MIIIISGSKVVDIKEEEIVHCMGKKRGYSDKTEYPLFFSRNLFSITLLPHFHPPPASPYPSAFELLWKQQKKVEAKSASTYSKRLSFTVTYSSLP